MGILRQTNDHFGGTRRPLVGIIANCLDRYGRDILQGATNYANLQRKWLLFKDMEMVLANRAELPPLDAVIFAGSAMKMVDAAMRQCEGRVVVCSGGGDPTISPVVAVDAVSVGRAAAEHLLECRLEHFGFYGHFPDYSVSKARLTGFEEVLKQAGFSCHLCPARPTSSAERASHEHRPEVIQWLRELPKPVGVLGFDDTHAHDLAEACLEAGIDVPNQVAIVGINNDHLLCESAWPPLSSVDADFSRLGYLAAGLIERLLAGEVLPDEERLVLLQPQSVVQRQSTNTLAIDDPDLAAALRFIREHACAPCSINDVLRAVPVGRRWLERQFAARLGRSPHDEILRVRIEAAERLLRKSEFKVLDIAGRCGFRDLRSFYRTFTQLTGSTPAAYRQAAQRDFGK